MVVYQTLLLAIYCEHKVFKPILKTPDLLARFQSIVRALSSLQEAGLLTLLEPDESTRSAYDLLEIVSIHDERLSDTALAKLGALDRALEASVLQTAGPEAAAEVAKNLTAGLALCAHLTAPDDAIGVAQLCRKAFEGRRFAILVADAPLRREDNKPAGDMRYAVHVDRAEWQQTNGGKAMAPPSFPGSEALRKTLAADLSPRFNSIRMGMPA